MLFFNLIEISQTKLDIFLTIKKFKAKDVNTSSILSNFLKMPLLEARHLKKCIVINLQIYLCLIIFDV